MKKAKLFYFSTLIIAVLSQSSCGTVKNSTENKSNSSFEVKFVPNSQNVYEGNIIVQVLDSKGQELTGAKVFIYSEGEQISELELNTTSMGVFYKEQKTLTIKVTKAGYADSKTELVTMSTENACFVEVRLDKK